MIGFKKQTKSIAVVVASGGLDTSVIAAIAAKNYQLAMFHVQYGQITAHRELQAFQDISNILNAKHRLVIQFNHFAIIGGSSLTDPDMKIPTTGVESGIVPITYVPFRNANLISAAVSWAEVIGASKIFIGINQMDSSGYPDCTSDFLDAFNVLVKHGTRPETDIEIVAPLLMMDKAEIVKTGIEYKAPMHKSWSCYQNNDLACGVCDSCRLRLAGFQRAGVKDPIHYVARIRNDL
ncbi:7-cyano-7-deazaguanine synthase QueC [bacterium]|nr:7-cyano-7-deazaguanine synthase QueC [bacterium]